MQEYKIQVAILQEQVRIYKAEVQDARRVWEKRLETLEVESLNRRNTESLARNNDVLQSGQPSLAVEMEGAARRRGISDPAAFRDHLGICAPTSAVCATATSETSGLT